MPINSASPYGEVYTGANFQISHYIESSYGAGTSLALANIGNLGVAEKVTTFQIDNQFEPLYNLGTREIAQYYSKGWRVNVTVEFVMCGDQKQWLNYVMAGNSGGTSTTWGVGNINSDAIVINTGEGTQYIVSGIVYTDASISITEGDVVKVTLSGAGQKFYKPAAAFTPSFTIPTDLYTYKDVTVESGIVKSFTIDIKNNPEQYYTLGALDYQAYLPLKFEASGKWEVYHNSAASLLPSTLPATVTSPANIQTNISCVIGTDSNKYTFTASNVVYNQSEMNVEPVQTVIDTITYIAGDLTVS